MSVTNLGNQDIYIQYGHEATSSYMNKILTNILKPGILEGAVCTWLATDDINIGAFKALVQTPTGELVKFETATDVPLTINSAQSYIVCNYTWLSTATNYLDFEAKALGAITSSDVVIAQGVYANVAAFTVGTIDMTTGRDYTVTNEDFKVNYSAGAGPGVGSGELTFTLTANCGDQATLIAHINAVIDATAYSSTLDFQAYDVGSGIIGIRTINTGVGETIAIASGTVNTDALLAFGITAATYNGGNYPTTFSYTAQTYNWRGADSLFDINNDLNVTGDATIEGNITVNGNISALGATSMFEDKNLLINRGGTTAGSTGAGIDIEGDAAAVVGYMRVTAGDNSLLELKAPSGNIMTVDINADKIVTIAGSLNVEADSNINQDLSSDADATFNSVSCTTGSALGVLATGTFSNTGLKIYDTGADNTLQITPSEDLTGDRVLSVNVNDGNRTLTVNTDVALNQDLETTDSVQFVNVTLTGVVNLPNAGLKVRDTAGAEYLTIACGSDLSIDRTLNIVTGDSDRTLTLSNSVALNQNVRTTDAVTFTNITATDITVSNAGGIHILDTGADHDLIIKVNEDLSADRTLNFVVNDADRTLALQGNLTIESASTIDQDLTSDANVTFNRVSVPTGQGVFVNAIQVLGDQVVGIVDAVTVHVITDPGAVPASATILRDDLVLTAIPETETALNNLGTKINSIISALESHGILATV